MKKLGIVIVSVFTLGVFGVANAQTNKDKTEKSSEGYNFDSPEKIKQKDHKKTKQKDNKIKSDQSMKNKREDKNLNANKGYEFDSERKNTNSDFNSEAERGKYKEKNKARKKEDTDM
jgi:hypothetical protein